MEKSIVLKVDGMSCEHCVKRVDKALKEVPGTVSVKVDLKAGTAAVQYLDEETGPDALRAAIEEAGYTAA